MEPFNVSALDRVDSHGRWDANLAATTSDATWRVEAFVRNISDDREVLTRTRPDPVTHNSQSVLSEPRIYGVRLEYNF